MLPSASRGTGAGGLGLCLSELGRPLISILQTVTQAAGRRFPFFDSCISRVGLRNLSPEKSLRRAALLIDAEEPVTEVTHAVRILT